MNNWSEAHKLRWREFWHSDLGKLAMEELEKMRDSDMLGALAIANTPDSAEVIVRAVQRASGVDSVINMIKYTTKSKKPSEDE